MGQIRMGVFLQDETEEGYKMSPEDKVLFWFIWVMAIVFSAIIFLTFVIARVTDSYDTVNRTLDALMSRERCSMINLAEKVMPKFVKKNPKYFPNYIISREQEF